MAKSSEISTTARKNLLGVDFCPILTEVMQKENNFYKYFDDREIKVCAQKYRGHKGCFSPLISGKPFE